MVPDDEVVIDDANSVLPGEPGPGEPAPGTDDLLENNLRVDGDLKNVWGHFRGDMAIVAGHARDQFEILAKHGAALAKDAKKAAIAVKNNRRSGSQIAPSISLPRWVPVHLSIQCHERFTLFLNMC